MPVYRLTYRSAQRGLAYEFREFNAENDSKATSLAEFWRHRSSAELGCEGRKVASWRHDYALLCS
jgi:hypothetical protein